MATCNSIDVRSLLGRFVVLTETVHGFEFERRGRVTAIVEALPDSRGSNAILLEQDGQDPEFYDVGDFLLHHVE